VQQRTVGCDERERKAAALYQPQRASELHGIVGAKRSPLDEIRGQRQDVPAYLDHNHFGQVRFDLTRDFDGSVVIQIAVARARPSSA
jgi:hypothetical protein